ncbi:MAG TPA: hypothetical protein VIY28_09175 [Pseudonocardiaceae bacterium]
MRKRKYLLVAGACLATLSLAVGTAMADPDPPTETRQLAGTGSDTTQGVMDALAGDVPTSGFAGIKDGAGNKIIASWDASGSATITTKPAPANCTFPRPSGSGAGVNALIAHRPDGGDGCLDFARSSANDSAARPGTHLAYIPFAVDAVTYATRETSQISRNLPKAVLVQMYNCQLPAGSFKPMLPQFNSGTRKFFLSSLGFTDAADFTSQPGHTCIGQTDASGNPLLENTGNLLTSDIQVEPYSVAVWLSQVSTVVDDFHGTTLLGNIDGVNSLQLNTSAPLSRDVYNVVPIPKLGVAPTSTTFVGPTSAVCSNTATIKKLGFAPNQNCGSTAIQTPGG